MRNPRPAMMVVSVFVGLLALATTLPAQTISSQSATRIPAFPNTLLDRVPSNRSGSIDLGQYSSDVLNCAICRERLGLPALGPSAVSATQTELVQPMVSNPTQKFSSPTPQVDRLLSESDLPPKESTTYGGSGLIKAGAARQLEASELITQEFRAAAEALPSAEQWKVENSKLVKQLAAAAKEREKLQEMIRVQAESFEKHMAEIERSHQETAKMLEARTLEVTELQNRWKAQPKSRKRLKAEPGNAKNKPLKNAPRDH